MAAAIALSRRLSTNLLKPSFAPRKMATHSIWTFQISNPKHLSPTNFDPTFDRSSSTSFHGSIGEKPRFFSSDSGSSFNNRLNLIDECQIYYVKKCGLSKLGAFLCFVNYLFDDSEASLIANPNFLVFGLAFVAALQLRGLVTGLEEIKEEAWSQTHRYPKCCSDLDSNVMLLRKRDEKTKKIAIVILVYLGLVLWFSYFCEGPLIKGVLFNQILVFWMGLALVSSKRKLLDLFSLLMLR